MVFSAVYYLNLHCCRMNNKFILKLQFFKSALQIRKFEYKLFITNLVTNFDFEVSILTASCSVNG